MADRASDALRSLRSLRLQALLTQEELALKSGLSTRTIRDIELGRVRPQPRTLRLLAEALELGPDGRTRLTGAPAEAAAVPRELPRTLASFTGRAHHLDSVFGAIDRGATVIAVHGMAGVGKTALAVHAAAALAERCPDGQLFVDLRGFTPSAPPLSTASVLTRVLRGLGADDRPLPTDPDELTARYRSVLADRRVLLVLDNAANAAQVEALLPGTPSSLVLATSRHDLSLLEGVHSVPLEPPPPAEAAAMLGAILPGRLAPAEAAAIAERCGRLPLAMELAAGRLRSRPLWSTDDLLRRLDDEDRLLAEFDIGHRGVTAALHASCRELDADQRRLLRRLALVPGDDADVHAAAALGGTGTGEAAALLESLVDVHLLETRAPGRYRLHDLVRLHASRLAAAEESAPDRDAAFARLLETYLHFAYRAAARVVPEVARFAAGAARYDAGRPGFADRETALAWFRTERGNLESAAAAAERAGLAEPAWHLACAFGGFFPYDRDPSAHAAVNAIGLAAARALGDAWKEAYALGYLGRQLGTEGRLRESIAHLERAVELKLDLGESGDAGLTLANIGVLHSRSGRFSDALAVYERALALAATSADPAAVAIVGLNMITPLIRLGRLDEAERRLRDAEARLAPGDLHNRTRLEVFRAGLRRERGDAAGAAELHRACLEALQREDVPAGTTATLIELGEDLLRLGRLPEATERFEQALAWAEDLADRSLERVARNGLGRALTASGRAKEALDHHRRAAAQAEAHEDAYELARAHHGLADAHHRDGDPAAARRHRDRALRGYAACGVPEAARLGGP
ncbi:ATP-binding protein [Glycomyces terrestris]|nr:tetratricopeptide repeat protein [Glycomyces terrestris]